MNAWILHIKNYAKKHNISYAMALKDPKCSQSYKKISGSGPCLSRRRVEPDNFQYVLPIDTGTPNRDITLPIAEARTTPSSRVFPDPTTLTTSAIIDTNAKKINKLVKKMNKNRKKVKEYTYDIDNTTNENFIKLLKISRNENIDRFVDNYTELQGLVPNVELTPVEVLINSEEEIFPNSRFGAIQEAVPITETDDIEGGKLKGFDPNKKTEILKYSNPNKALDNAIKYLKKDIVFALSTKKTKKYMVQRPDGKWVHFGAMGYQDFTKHKDKKRQLAYLKRTENMKGDWKKDKFSANNLAREILWR